MTIKGQMMAAAVAGLFASAAAPAAHAGTPPAKKVHCEGINSCSGKGACKSAHNACAGKNGCKGKGWLEVSEKECKDKGGKVVTDSPSHK